MKNILKKFTAIFIPIVTISIVNLKVNPSPLKRSKSIPNNLNLYPQDMSANNIIRRLDMVGDGILVSSASTPDLNNIDNFYKIRYKLLHSEFIRSRQENRVVRFMPNIQMNHYFFKDIYEDKHSPIVNTKALNFVTRFNFLNSQQ